MVVVKDMDKLKRTTVLRGFTQSELAKKIGVSRNTICSIFKGIRNPSPKIAVKICEQLNVSFEYIFFIEGVHKKEQE